MLGLEHADKRNLQQLVSGSTGIKEDGLEVLGEQYKNYKESHLKNIKLDPENVNLNLYYFSPIDLLLALLVDHTLLEEVFIFFDTATYDEIERDVKVSKTTYFDCSKEDKNTPA